MNPSSSDKTPTSSQQNVQADNDSIYKVDKRTLALITISLKGQLQAVDQEDGDGSAPDLADISDQASASVASALLSAVELTDLPSGVDQDSFLHQLSVTGVDDFEDGTGQVYADVAVRLYVAEDENLGRLRSVSNAQDVEAALGPDAAKEIMAQSGYQPALPEDLERLAELSPLPEEATQQLRSLLVCCLEDCDLFPLRAVDVEAEAHLVHSFSGRGESDDVVRMWAGMDDTKQDLMGEWRERVGDPSRKSWRLRIVQTASALYSMRRPFEDIEHEFAYGPLLEAAEQGKTFFIEDINHMPASVSAELMPFIDGYDPGDIVQVLESGGSFEVAPGFMIVASVDEDSESFAPTGQALSSRMA